jgi:hypothetical protein
MYLQIGQYRENDKSRTDIRNDHASGKVLLGEHREFGGQLGHHHEKNAANAKSMLNECNMQKNKTICIQDGRDKSRVSVSRKQNENRIKTMLPRIV